MFRPGDAAPWQPASWSQAASIRADAVIHCPACQHANPAEAKFCAQCGSKLPSVCGRCGTAVVAGARFCTQCGNPVTADAPAPPPTDPHPALVRRDDAERRQLTVMFCDLVGSTRLAAILDPEDLRELNRAYRKLCADTIERYDGYIARYMGDGVLAYFGYPRAHEDDAARAVRAGLDITAGAGPLGNTIPAEEAIAIRVGIATGPVVVGELIGEGAAQEHDVVGETPNLAARLQGLARPDAVVIGAETRKLLGAAFDLDDLGLQSLKGFDQPVAAWRVIGTAVVETRFDAAHAGRLTPFVGREHEVALILDRWRRAGRGNGQVVLLSGEPGIGKSRIMQTARAELADTGFMPVRWQCSPYHQSSALYPVIDQLQRASGFSDGDSDEQRLNKLIRLLKLSDMTDAETIALFAALLSLPPGDRYPHELDPEVQRERTLAAIVRGHHRLTQRKPLLMFVEDVHWADPTTLVLLNHLVEQIGNWHALLLITFRPEFDPPWTGDPQVSLLSLNRLDRAQTQSIVAELTGGKPLPREVLDQIASKTDGVPLFVEELTRTILESGLVAEQADRYVLAGPMQELAIPTTLQDSLMARLDQLDEAKSLAQIGSAIGREFSHALLTAVSGRSGAEIEPALDRLMNSGLVYRRGAGARASYVFKHALVQDAAYNSLLKSRRHALHGRIAEALRHRFPDMVRMQPELLAQHYAAAGLDTEAVPCWREAGRHAMEQSAYEEAVAHFRRGIDSLSHLQRDANAAEQVVEFSTSIAECLRIVDQLEEAFTSLQQAEDVATEFGLTQALARVHYQRGNLYFPMARTEGCLAEHTKSLDYARNAHSTEDEARALGGLGDAHYVAGRMRTAFSYFDRCVNLAREHDFPRIAAANLSMRGFSRMYLLELREALRDGLDSVEIASRARHPRARLLGQSAGYMMHYYMGSYEQALEFGEQARETSQRMGAHRFEAQHRYYRALGLYGLGRSADAMSLLNEAEDLARRYSPTFTLPRVLGAVALVTDDPARRARALDEAEKMLDAGAVSHNYFIFSLTATDSCFEHEEWDRMEYYADKLEVFSENEPLPWTEFVAARGRALAAWGRGDGSEALFAELQRLRALAEETRFNVALGPIKTALSSGFAPEVRKQSVV